MTLLGLAVRTLPLGYRVCRCGPESGQSGTAILGMVLLGEPVTVLRVVFIGLIVCGISWTARPVQ